VNRTTGYAPVDVTFANSESLHKNLYTSTDVHKVRFRYKRDQFVRIAKEKHKLQKGYTANFTDEIFIIDKCLPRNPPVYRLKDIEGEPIIGVFYEAELTPALNIQKDILAPLKDNNVFAVEKIIKRRTRNKVKEVFVKWLDYSNKFNQWIPAKDVYK